MCVSECERDNRGGGGEIMAVCLCREHQGWVCVGVCVELLGSVCVCRRETVMGGK